MSKQVLIELNELKKYFPLKRDSLFTKNKLFVKAVDEVSIKIKQGETFGLVGESGCGKSTLGRTILQLYPSTSGSALYYGKKLEDVNPKYIKKEYASLPKYQAKAIQLSEKASKLDQAVEENKAQLATLSETDKQYLALTNKIEKLQERSLELKKDSSRQLREGAKSVGSLILEENIEHISELLVKSSELIDQIFNIKLDIDKEYTKMVDIAIENNEYTEEKQQECDAFKAGKLEEAQPEIDDLTQQIDQLRQEAESYKGQRRLVIHEKVDEDFAQMLDEHKETGINLDRLTNEEMRKMRNKLQIIFQDPYSSLNPRMSVGQIISEAVHEHGMYKRNTPEMEAYILDIMKKCGLDAYMIHRYPHQFSGGQRQRIGIARALALQPEFIVADEAVSALDVSIQSQIINLLEDLKHDNKLTYLFISHDLSVIKHISDRIGVMYLGKMVELADSEEIYESPLHPYTKALISAIPSVEDTGREKILLEGDIPSNIFPPSGCKFRTRCPIATPYCAEVEPEYKEVKPNHFVACHFYEKTKDI